MTEERKIKTSKRTIWGVILMIVPVVLFFIAIPGYAISTFVFANLMMGSGGQDWALVAKIVNVLLSLLGVVAVLSLFVCIPIGIYLVATKGKADQPATGSGAEPMQSNTAAAPAENSVEERHQ